VGELTLLYSYPSSDLWEFIIEESHVMNVLGDSNSFIDEVNAVTTDSMHESCLN